MRIPLDDGNGYDSKHKKPFIGALISLVGHMLGTGVIFLSLFFIAWGLAWSAHMLHMIHPFPDEILGYVKKVEIVLFWVDTALCGFVSLVGIWRFGAEILGD